MEGLTESENSPLLGETSDQEPCIPQISLQDIPEPSGTCPQPGVVVMMEPSSFHVGPSSSMLGPTSTMSLGP